MRTDRVGTSLREADVLGGLLAQIRTVLPAGCASGVVAGRMLARADAPAAWERLPVADTIPLLPPW
jgi:hypothetical protein